MTQSRYEDVAPGQPPPGPGSDSPDAEAVLSQALRAMAGGSRTVGTASSPGDTSSSPGDTAADRTPLTTAQVLLIAAIIGLVIGMAAAFTVLLNS